MTWALNVECFFSYQKYSVFFILIHLLFSVPCPSFLLNVCFKVWHKFHSAFMIPYLKYSWSFLSLSAFHSSSFFPLLSILYAIIRLIFFSSRVHITPLSWSKLLIGFPMQASLSTNPPWKSSLFIIWLQLNVLKCFPLCPTVISVIAIIQWAVYPQSVGFFGLADFFS